MTFRARLTLLALLVLAPNVARGQRAQPARLTTFDPQSAAQLKWRYIGPVGNRVASVVGRLSIEIFGYHNPRCRDYAVFLGKALQLTNILRDVRADAERGRIYLPLEELERCSVRPEEILRLEYSPRFGRAAASVADRARDFYRQAREALPDEERRSMGAAELMGSVYWRLLQKLETQRFNVFDPATTRVSKPQKLFLIFRTWYRLTTGAMVPNYGAP